MCSLFSLSYQYLLSDCLERFLWGRLFVSRRLSPQRPRGRALLCVLVYCFFVLLCVSPHPYAIYSLLLWHDSLFVLKAPLNTKQLTNPYGVRADERVALPRVYRECAYWADSDNGLSTGRPKPLTPKVRYDKARYDDLVRIVVCRRTER